MGRGERRRWRQELYVTKAKAIFMIMLVMQNASGTICVCGEY